ncbi:4-hydroxyphenylpyruvate dioxygenase [Cynara cardunculus var. scolymus]|uniref:4-hydroxyphenylpyruvate dioxygenase n=1 Tax=Cynara cardunculus var. scolymus TaxID=59895 RepID=A0A103XH65_CYNCS|nr:4-hydroxyphenylpyruvate dioxygenase [Cynara cardunculus var. scolymus]
MPIVAKSDLSAENKAHASYLLRCGQLLFLITAPYSATISTVDTNTASIPTFSHAACRAFIAAHGLAVRSVAIEVDDAELAYSISVSNGAKSFSLPITLGEPENSVVISEVQVYNDAVLRYISYTKPTVDIASTFLSGFEPIETSSSFPGQNYDLRCLDHAFGTVPELASAVNYLKSFTGFHKFAEIGGEDIGTIESWLNTVCLACNDETVILGLCEPVYGTPWTSQILTYFEHNEGPGFQHLALESEDIFWTLREMKQRSGFGGLALMPPPLRLTTGI